MDSLHFTILPSHTPDRAHQLLAALREAVSTVKVTHTHTHTRTHARTHTHTHVMVFIWPEKGSVSHFRKAS